MHRILIYFAGMISLLHSESKIHRDSSCACKGCSAGRLVSVDQPVSISSLLGSARLRGGSNNREEMEARIRQERALEAERFQKSREALEKKKLEKARSEMQQLALKEEEEARNQLIQKRKRKLPELVTLENLSRYAKELLEDREYDQAIEAYRRVLLVDPYDVEALHDLGYIMQGASKQLVT